MLFCRCKCLCGSSKIWWSIKVVWWRTSCILTFIKLILQIVKFLKQHIQLGTHKNPSANSLQGEVGLWSLIAVGDVFWVLHCFTLPLCGHKYNPTPLGSIPLWLHTFLTALITFIGRVFWKPAHSYKKALGLISQSMLTMPLANFIPSPLPTVSLACLHAHMYTCPR